jgi:hypothetical protein
MSEMSFREKSAWISFVLLLVVFGAYFWSVGSVLEGGIEYETGLMVQIGLIIAFVVLEIVLHLAIVVQAPSEARAPRDERERLIEMRSTRIAFHVLVLGALGCVGLMHITRSAWAIGQHVLLAIVVAQLVRFGAQIVYFRRGV